MTQKSSHAAAHARRGRGTEDVRRIAGAMWSGDAILVEFETGERFRLPAATFARNEPIRKLRGSGLRVESFAVTIPRPGDDIELPWDFIRYHCDARYRREADRQAVETASRIAERVAKARKRAGLTQEDLAARSAVSRPTIARLETGETPSFRTLERLAKSLGLTLTELLGR